jgi:putative ABC transport system substrate-binding protein
MNAKDGHMRAALTRRVGADEARRSTLRILLVAAGALVAAPFGSFAQQQGKVWRVGFLTQRHRPVSFDPDFVGLFTQGMRDLGYVEGKNLVIEWRFADDKVERLPGLAAELVQLKVDVIVANASAAISAPQKATTTIPIVMTGTGDPVGSGFVKTLARPGGNITGLSSMSDDIHPKLLELLITMVPKLARVAVLVDPNSLTRIAILKGILAAAQNSGAKILPVEARTPAEIENAFSMIAKDKAQAIIVSRSGFFIQQGRQIAELAAKNRMPSIHGVREYVEAGGLMSYGPKTDFRRAASYVDKIFKGAKPGELPVEQPTTFELLINGKTAKTLGLKIPQSLLISADKVIE